MNTLSRAVITALLLSGASFAVSAPAAAKEKEAAPAGPAIPKLTKAVQVALIAAQKAQTAGDSAAALAAARQAEAVPNLTPDDVYMTNAVKINIAIATKDNVLLEEALQKAMASGKVPAETQPKFVRNLGALALQRKDYAAATRYFEQLQQIAPNDSENIVALAELYQAQKQSGKAVDTLAKAIAASKANGQTAPQEWYRRQLAIAYDAKLPQTQATAQALVAAYPNATNWRDVLIITRDSMKLDDYGNLDFMRLQLAAGALNGERDYAEYVDTALGKGLYGEAQTALNEGIGKNMLSRSKPYVVQSEAAVAKKIPADKASLPGLEKEAKANPKTALLTGDAYYGYANYAKAIEMYRLAAASPTSDSATVNLRLGAALARSGDKAGAATAFKAVKGGPREVLAQYWLAWIGQGA